MLLSLSVRDYALIESVDLEFEPGFTVITGETGAGKSILAGALGAMLGERTSAEVVRAGAERAIIEARFRIDESHLATKALLETGGEAEDDGVWLFRREIHSAGRSRAWIGGVQTTVGQMKAIGERIVDFHGQHDHQLLLAPEEHTALLDGFGGHGKQLEAVQSKFEELQSSDRLLSNLTARRDAWEKDRELAEFQAAEYDEIDPQPGELAALDSERGRLENVERLGELLDSMIQLLSEGDSAVVDTLGKAKGWLTEASGFDTSLESSLANLDGIGIEVDDLASTLSDHMARLEADPMRLETVHERMGQLRKLTRKYGSLEAATVEREKLASTEEAEHQLDGEIQKARSEMNQTRRMFADACLTLSSKREKAAERLSKEVSSSLANLGMEKASLHVALNRIRSTDGDATAVEMESGHFQAGPKGVESAEFFFSANLGEPERPLAKVASGGEVSRIMLAIKSVVAENDPVLTLVFDEIDVGVSGRTAEAVGTRMRELSDHRQVLSITHLPQIARAAQHHFEVTKSESGNRTVTTIKHLTGEDRTRAIAALLGGEPISKTALEHARAMLEEP